jgi:hypothetical protein
MLGMWYLITEVALATQLIVIIAVLTVGYGRYLCSIAFAFQCTRALTGCRHCMRGVDANTAAPISDRLRWLASQGPCELTAVC